MSLHPTSPLLAKAAIRCAIYTRKSTEEGLEQEFNTLDAQREAGQSFIASQRHEGWTLVPTRYDDGGFSCVHLDRPALQKLLADVRSGRVHCVVVYKVDRLTRSLLDFSRIMDVLDRHRATFVSVTQQFNTTSSLGRGSVFTSMAKAIDAEARRQYIASTKMPTRQGLEMLWFYHSSGGTGN